MGSVVDVLFVSSVVGTALLGALAVMLKDRRSDPPRAPDAEREEPKGSDPS